MANPNPNMNGLKPFLTGEDNRRKGNGRKPVKFLTELLIKELKSKKDEIIIEGLDFETGLPVKVRVPMPTKQQIVQALLRQAKKGDVNAIREVLDRVEGKTPQALNFQDNEGNALPIQLIFQPMAGNEPLIENG